MRLRPAPIAVTLTIAACVGACGPGSDESAVRQTVRQWISAVARNDGPAACAVLSTDLQHAIARHLLGEGVQGSCRTWAARYVSPRHVASHKRVRITAVRVQGSVATITLVVPGLSEAHVNLVREHGQWRIDDY